MDGKAKDVTTSFQVVVGEARAAKTVEVTAKTPAITVGGTTELTIVPKDQYGEFIEVKTSGNTAPVFQIVGDNFVGGELTPITEDKKDGKTVAYKVTVKGLKAGSGTVKVNVLGAKDKDDKQPVLATASQTITVDSVGKLVDTVEITENEIQNTNGAEKAVVLEAIGKDKAGNEVAINDTDLTWSIKSVKDAEGNALTLDGDLEQGAKLKNAKGEYLVAGGKFEATGTNAVTVKLEGNKLTGAKGLTVEVEVEVTTANQKKATSVVKFDGEGSKFAKDLAVFNATFKGIGEGEGKTVAAKDLTDNGLKISFTEDQVAEDGTIGDIKLTFTGVDQYGKPMVKDEKGTVKLKSFTSDNIGAVTTVAETLTLKAVAEGTATVYATVGGETLEIEVTVPKSVVAKADKVKADAALGQVKIDAKSALTTAYAADNYTKEGNKTAYEKVISDANKAIDAAKDEAGVTAAKKAAEEVLKEIKTNTQLTEAEKDANETAAAAALEKAEEVAKLVKLADGDTAVSKDSAKATIENAIKEALKDGATAFDGEVTVTVEATDGFKAAVDGVEGSVDGTDGYINFKITITKGSGDTKGTAESTKAIKLGITAKKHS